MTAALQKLGEFAFPLPADPWCQQPACVSPDRRYVGIPTASGVLGILDSRQIWNALRSVKVPPNSRLLALHPDGQRLAAVFSGSVGVLDGDGVVISLLSWEDAWGEPRALSFSRSGTLLCVSSEIESTDGRDNRLMIFETSTLRSKGKVELRGGTQSAHFQTWHPSRDCVCVEVACGQDGSWLNFVDLEPGVPELLPQEPRVGESYFMLGFAADGNSFAGVGARTVWRWSFPKCEEVARYELPDGWWADYGATDWKGLIVFPFEEERGRQGLIGLDERSLKPVDRFELPTVSPVASIESLPGGYFLMGEVEKTGVVTVADRKPERKKLTLFRLVR